MTTEELNGPAFYCVLTLSETIPNKQLYLGSDLVKATMAFVAGTVHGRGKTADDALAQAAFNLAYQKKLQKDIAALKVVPPLRKIRDPQARRIATENAAIEATRAVRDGLK